MELEEANIPVTSKYFYPSGAEHGGCHIRRKLVGNNSVNFPLLSKYFDQSGDEESEYSCDI